MFEGRPEWVAKGRAPLDENFGAPVFIDCM